MGEPDFPSAKPKPVNVAGKTLESRPCFDANDSLALAAMRTRQRLDQLAPGATGDAALSARALLDSAASSVTSELSSSTELRWSAPRDRAVADRVRVQILDALVKLN